MLLPAVLLTMLLVGFVAVRGGSAGEAELRAALPYLIAVNHTLVFAILVFLLRREGRTLRDIGWRVPGPEPTATEIESSAGGALPAHGAGPGRPARMMREIAIGLAAGIALYLFKELVFDSLRALAAGNRPTFTTLFRIGLDTAEIPLLMVSSAFILVEESVYRGYGLSALLARWGRLASLLTMALLFGLLHWGNGLVAIGYTALLGLGFGVFFLWRRTLWSPTVAHGLYNALIVLT